jgi:methionine sulfoxide reductase heme-binding subunit
MNDPEMHVWLLARTSGVLAYVLLTLAVLAGLSIKARIFGRTLPVPALTATHKLLSSLGLVATVLHAGLIVADTKVDVPLVAAFVPGMSGYRTLATGLGVLAVELWVIVHFSFALRKRIGVKRWRSLHKLTFGVWGMAAVHGIAAGTDSGTAWMHDLYSFSIAAVLGVIGWRVLVVSPPKPRPAPTPRKDTSDERSLPDSPGPVTV